MSSPSATRRRSRRTLVVGLGLLGLVAGALALRGPDPVADRARVELGGFVQWLDRNDAEGFIGEVGWPAGRAVDGDDWQELAREWYAQAAEADLWVTAWSTGEMWSGLDDPLTIYAPMSAGEALSLARTQAEVIEEQAPERRGVNVSGGEFGAVPQVEPTSPWSNAEPGTYGQEWRYDTQASFDYIAQRGITMVRLPFRWERIQPELDGPLAAAELGRLQDAVRRAGDAGLSVILDVHNFGGYYREEDGQGVRLTVGSDELPAAALADLWGRLSAEFASEPAIGGYTLMNEPAELSGREGRTPAQVWEEASQAALDAIRRNDDDTLVLVPGYDWAAVRGWAEEHPQGWIIDPLDHFRYEAHHYWDADRSGGYRDRYGDEIAAARS